MIRREYRAGTLTFVFDDGWIDVWHDGYLLDRFPVDTDPNTLTPESCAPYCDGFAWTCAGILSERLEPTTQDCAAWDYEQDCYDIVSVEVSS